MENNVKLLFVSVGVVRISAKFSFSCIRIKLVDSINRLSVRELKPLLKGQNICFKSAKNYHGKMI